MKQLIILAALCFMCMPDVSAQVKAGTLVRKRVVETEDSIEYYDVEVGSKQQSYLKDMTGTWQVLQMKRQPRMPAETLSNVQLQINGDSTFSGSGGCNTLNGTFSLKGTSIKFKNISTTKMACFKMEQEQWFIKLLQESVSAYSVSPDLLLLRDGSGNVIFEAKRTDKVSP